LIVGQAGENHIGRASQFSNVFRNDTTVHSHGFRFCEIPIVYGELVSAFQQALCDPASHVTQANESEFHLICTKLFHRVSVIS
jgi:hypothetical protein